MSQLSASATVNTWARGNISIKPPLCKIQQSRSYSFYLGLSALKQERTKQDTETVRAESNPCRFYRQFFLLKRILSPQPKTESRVIGRAGNRTPGSLTPIFSQDGKLFLQFFHCSELPPEMTATATKSSPDETPQKRVSPGQSEPHDTGPGFPGNRSTRCWAAVLSLQTSVLSQGPGGPRSPRASKAREAPLSRAGRDFAPPGRASWGILYRGVWQ